MLDRRAARPADAHFRFIAVFRLTPFEQRVQQGVREAAPHERLALVHHHLAAIDEGLAHAELGAACGFVLERIASEFLGVLEGRGVLRLFAFPVVMRLACHASDLRGTLHARTDRIGRQEGPLFGVRYGVEHKSAVDWQR
jgi:hypothetical protein